MRIYGRIQWWSVLAVAGFALLAGRGWAQASATVQHQMAEGRQYEQRQQLSAAADSYRAALKAAGGSCMDCLDALARVQLTMELYKDSAATAAQMAKQSPDARTKAQAEYREGLALFQQYFAQSDGRGAIDKDPKKASAALKQADVVLAQGVADDPANEAARMLHGRVLAALKRDEEAEREFTACAAVPGTSEQECARALHFAKDVAAARDEPAPQFTLKTVDGARVSLDSLAGKVVLIDFWATWCQYCVRDSDYVQSMVDSFDKDKFVLLEVDVDESETKWSNYVSDHRLQGVQTRDDKGEMASLFHVGGYPTYVIVDGDGTVRLRATGIEGDLKGTVRKLLADAAKTPAAETRTPLSKSGSE